MADYLVCQRTKQINDCGLITCAFATFTSRNNVKLWLYWTGVYIKPSLEIKWEWASKPNGQTKLFIEIVLQQLVVFMKKKIHQLSKYYTVQKLNKIGILNLIINLGFKIDKLFVKYNLRPVGSWKML